MVSKKGKKKGEQKELPTEHIAEWRVMALRLGWDELDVGALGDVLALDPTSRVVSVTMHKIKLLQFRRFSIGGIGRDGIYRERLIERSGYHVWKNPVKARSIEASANEWSDCWCPSHGVECEPTPEGCGYNRVKREVCTCPHRSTYHFSTKKVCKHQFDDKFDPSICTLCGYRSRRFIMPSHDAKCEIVERDAKERLNTRIRDAIAAAEAPAAAAPAPPSEPTKMTMGTKAVERRRYGAPLPGQLSLPLATK